MSTDYDASFAILMNFIFLHVIFMVAYTYMLAPPNANGVLREGVMRLPYAAYIVVASLVVIAGAGACGGDSSARSNNTQASPGATDAAPTGTNQPTPGPSAAGQAPQPQFTEFDPGKFSQSTNIDNEWYPLKPGTRWVYEGYTTERRKKVPHRLQFTVTDLTKEILGVRTAVAWIEDFTDGELVEKEIAFYAQDDDGNVWYFGEHPEEYKAGEFVEAPTWIAGIRNSKPGIKMWTDPRPEIPSYYQGWGPAVDWSDYAQVDQTGQQTCVPVGCYEDVLVLAESSLGEGDIFQIKFYARGAGEVRVGWRGPDSTAEELELVERSELAPDALAASRADALALEAHAYEISTEVYGQTAPAH